MNADLLIIFRVLHYALDQLEKIMADLASLQASTANLKAQVDALEAKEASKPATVLQSDLDPIVNDINTEASRVQQLANAP